MSIVPRKLKVLAIHGYRQSDTVFRGKLGSLRKSFKQNIDFHFVQAPHSVPPLETDNEQEEAAAEGYGWWFNTEDRYFKATEPSDTCVGFDESVALIEKTFQESGPFHGVLGFSQGAAFVAILCAMQQKKLSSVEFDFAIMISGFKSLCKPHEVFYDPPVQLRSFHVYGETDKIIPTAMAKELSDLFENKKTVTHEGGHYVPGKKSIYADFIYETLALKSTIQ